MAYTLMENEEGFEQVFVNEDGESAERKLFKVEKMEGERMEGIVEGSKFLV